MSKYSKDSINNLSSGHRGSSTRIPNYGTTKKPNYGYEQEKKPKDNY